MKSCSRIVSLLGFLSLKTMICFTNFRFLQTLSAVSATTEDVKINFGFASRSECLSSPKK